MQNLTKNFDYWRLNAEEKSHSSDIEITEDLTAWNYYWGRIGRIIASNGFDNLAEYLCRNIPTNGRLEILSLASGYCGHEIDLARRMTRPYRVTCTELNGEIFDKARAVASAEGLSIDFEIADLNFISIQPNKYDLIFAHAAIHHVINLEHLFEQIMGGLSSAGILHITEVVGLNRKLIWDQNERYANCLLSLIPERITKGIRLSIPDEAVGMEGVRQEDIVPLLRQHFSTVFQHLHGAFMRFICTHGELGPIFDPRRSDTRRYLDFLIASDDCAVRHGILVPLELWGIYKVRSTQDPQAA